MKKIFFSLLAVAALASCVKSEAVYTEDQAEIKIKPATALATKAAIDGTEYPVTENFDVYGYWADEKAGSSFTEGTVYLGKDGPAVEFTNKGNYWGGTTPYYWPKNGSLRFAAYSPSNVNMEHELATDTYTVEGYTQPATTAATWDLLVAPTSVSYDAMTAAENVSVVFEHALSWITVKVVAKDAEAAKAFDIKKVTIEDVANVADFEAVMSGTKSMTWTLDEAAEKVDYVVYSGSQAVTETATVIETTKDGTLVIPQATTSITVEYTQNALAGTPALEKQSVNVDLVLDAENSPWMPGKHYVYTLVFGLDEILINPDVVDWEDVVVEDVEVGTTNVYTAEQLQAAFKKGGKIVLKADIKTTDSFKVEANSVLDLNGHTITGTDELTTSYALIEVQPDVTFTVDGPGTLTVLPAAKNREWNAYSSVLSNQRGTLIVNEGVVIEHLGGTDMAYGIDNLTNTGAEPAVTVVNGATIKSTYRAIRQFLNSATGNNELKVKAGSKIIGGNKSIWAQDANKNANPGKLTVEEGAELQGDVLLSVTAGSTAWPVEVAVADASFADGYTVVTGNEGLVATMENGVWTAELAYVFQNNVATVSTPEALMSLVDKINSGEDFYAGKTIKLGADIDLKDVEWTPIGSATAEHGFMGNFDGNGYIIKNLNMTNVTPDSDGYSYAGFFGVTEGEEGKENYIKNLVIENVNIETTGAIAAAAIAYPYYTTLENITVKGDINIKGGDYTAGVLAYTRRCYNASNISIIANDGSTITGGKTIGGVISDIQTNDGLAANYSNFKASGLTITGEMSVGGISGIICLQTLNGATVENVTLVCDDVRTGIVSGSTGGKSTITNVSHTNVSGARHIIGATFDKGIYVGQIIDVEGVDAIVYTINDEVKAVSVEEQTLQNLSWQSAMDWAAGLGNGWELASMEDLNTIYDLRFELNDALEANNPENALFWEGDELYIKNGSVYYACYLSSTEAPAGEKDANGNVYFSNRVFFKMFNDRGYWDVPYSSFDCINKSAPLRDNYFARATITL